MERRDTMLRIYARLLAAALVVIAAAAAVGIPKEGLGGRLRLRWLSARGGCVREKRGGDHGLGFVGVGAFVGASDGHPWVPLRGEGLGSGAGARRPRRIYDGVCGVVALR